MTFTSTSQIFLDETASVEMGVTSGGLSEYILTIIHMKLVMTNHMCMMPWIYIYL